MIFLPPPEAILPAIMFRRDVFPEPDGPRMAVRVLDGREPDNPDRIVFDGFLTRYVMFVKVNVGPAIRYSRLILETLTPYRQFKFISRH